MQKIDKNKFLFLFVNGFGPLSDPQRNGLTFLLDQLMLDDQVTDWRHAAYMLATAWHETAKTMRPIAEYGRGVGKKYGLPDKKTGHIYYGRGYVQLTWPENYQGMGQALGIDLYNEPDKAMQPDVAYAIMSRGMRKGSFTGVKLSTYINDVKCDYLHARKIINLMDCAELIAGYAVKIEGMFNQSMEVEE